MASQFDLYRMPSGTLVVILQSDLLEAMRTRVVAPLLPTKDTGPEIRYLTPSFLIGETEYRLMPQLAATLTHGELGQRIGSLAAERDRITRATDMLLSGI